MFRRILLPLIATLIVMLMFRVGFAQPDDPLSPQ
jgi:hypothetical protein